MGFFRSMSLIIDIFLIFAPTFRRDEEHWKVVLTEEEFQKRMFEED